MRHSSALTEVCNSEIHARQINAVLSAYSVESGRTHSTSLAGIFTAMCYSLPFCFASACFIFQPSPLRIVQEFGSLMGFWCDVVFSRLPMGGMGRD